MCKILIWEASSFLFKVYLGSRLSFFWVHSFCIWSIAIGIWTSSEIWVCFSEGCYSWSIGHKIAPSDIDICTAFIWVVLGVFIILKLYSYLIILISVDHKTFYKMTILNSWCFVTYMIFMIDISSICKKPSVQPFTRYTSTATFISSRIMKCSFTSSFHLIK